MASNSVSVEAKLDEKGVVKGAKKIKVSLEDIKRADGKLRWDGVGEGARAAGRANDAFTVLKGTLAGLATTGIASAASAVAGLASDVVRTGQDFSTSMSKVAALSGATADDLAALEACAREMGASTRFSAGEAADALGYMALAGWDAAQSMEGLPGVLDLAAASGMGLAEASDMVTDYLSAFGLEAKDSSRLADMLAHAQANSNTSAQQLGEAYKNCAANLNAAGQDVETVTSLLAMMANQGLKGSEAGTALAAIMRDITQNMQDGAIAIGDTSVAVTDSEGNFRDLTDILADVEAATYGMGDAERAAALGATFTADSTKGLNLLLNAGIGEAAGFEEGLRGCEGAASDMAKTMGDNLEGDLLTLNSAFEELQLKCFDAVEPALRGVASAATDVLLPAVSDALFGVEQSVPVYDELGTQVGTASERAGGLAGALQGLADKAGPAMEAAGAAVGGLWENAQPSLQMLGDKAAGLAGTLSDGLGGALDALGPAASAAGGLLSEAATVAFDGAATAAGTLSDGLGKVSGVFAEIAEVAGPPLAEFFGGFDLSAASQTVQDLADTFTASLDPVIETASTTLVPALGDAFQALADHLPEIQGTFDTVVGGIGNIIGTVFGAASTTVSTSMTMISDVISIVLAAIDGDWSGVWSGVQQLAGDVWNGFTDLANTVFPGLGDTIDGFLGDAQSWWEEKWGAVSDFTDSTWQSIQGFIEDPVGTLTGSIDGFISGVADQFSSWGIDATVDSTFQAIKGFMEDPIGTAKDTISGLCGDIMGFFSGMHFEWPHIALPHFSVSGSINPIDWFSQGVPHLNVEWYATGGIATGPSVVGIGEAGDEAVVPLSGRHMDPFADAVADRMGERGGGGDTYITINLQATVREEADIEEVARLLGERVDRELRRRGVTR